MAALTRALDEDDWPAIVYLSGLRSGPTKSVSLRNLEMDEKDWKEPLTEVTAGGTRISIDTDMFSRFSKKDK